MKTIAFAMQKGGVGKSTLSIHLAVEMSKDSKVAIIDMDPQATVTKWRGRRDREEPSVLTCDSQHLAAKLESLKSEGFDYVLLDLPGRTAPVANEGIRVSDLVLIPARPLDIDIEASGDTVATAQRLKRPYAFVMNVASHIGKRAQQFADGLKDHGQRVIPVHVMERVAYPYAIAEGLGVSEHDPESKAAAEIAAFKNAVFEFLNGEKNT